MKTRLVKWIALLSAAILALSPLGVSAAEIEELDFKEGRGSVTATVEGIIKDEYGQPERKIPLIGAEYAIYQVWSLDEKGTVIPNDAFKDVTDHLGNKISQNYPHETLPAFDENAYRAKEEFYVANEAFMKQVDVYVAAAEGIEPYGTVSSDENGKIEVKGLPYGGYLFAVMNPDKQVYDTANRYEGYYVISDFMVSVPVLTEEGGWVTDVVATPKTFQPEKEGVLPAGEFGVAKVNQKGNPVAGATLKIVNSTEVAADGTKTPKTGERTADPVTNLADNIPAEWVTDEVPYMLVLEEGYYTLYEEGPDDGVELPEGYKIAPPLNFHVDSHQGVSYYDDSWAKKTTAADGSRIQYDSSGLAYVQVSEDGHYYVDGAADKLITLVDPVDIDIEKTVNSKHHEDLKAKEEIFEYEIKTTIASIAEDYFIIKDVLEPVLEFVTEYEVEGEETVPYLGIYVDDPDLENNLRDIITSDDADSSVTYDLESERQSIEIRIEGAELEEYRGMDIVVTFLAKIKADADLSPYANEYVPNTASYRIDNGPEVLSNTVTVVPPKKIVNIPVSKIWDDDDDAAKKRPQSITIVLCANGEETDKVLTLDESNGWSGKFTGLPKEDANGAIKYSIIEKEVANYESTIRASSSGGFAVTNTYVPNKPIVTPETSRTKTQQPKTGDSSRAGLFGALFAGAAAAAVLLGTRRRKNEE